MSNQEVELDQHGTAGRQVSALLSAALAAAQAGAQVAAQRARERTRQADQQTRQAEQRTREQQRQAQQAEAAVQRQLERQQHAEQAVRHRQWGLKPTAQWLHDNPLSAAAAWASADVHRGDDPVAARHADQWETVFKREEIDIADVRANAPSAERGQSVGGGASPGDTPGEGVGDMVAAEVAGSAALAGAVDTAHAAESRADKTAPPASSWQNLDELRAKLGLDTTPAPTGERKRWFAYADGAPAAALGGRGVSTPPHQVLTAARKAPDLGSATATTTSRAAELVTQAGLEQ